MRCWSWIYREREKWNSIADEYKLIKWLNQQRTTHCFPSADKRELIATTTTTTTMGDDDGNNNHWNIIEIWKWKLWSDARCINRQKCETEIEWREKCAMRVDGWILSSGKRTQFFLRSFVPSFVGSFHHFANIVYIRPINGSATERNENRRILTGPGLECIGRRNRAR